MTFRHSQGACRKDMPGISRPAEWGEKMLGIDYGDEGMGGGKRAALGIPDHEPGTTSSSITGGGD